MDRTLALVVSRAESDRGVLATMRAQGRQLIRRGLVLFVSGSAALVAVNALGQGLDHTLLYVLRLAAGVTLGIGFGRITVGVRRRSLATKADRILEARRLPVAQVRR
ncbi:MAG TPA: hypothetical protein VGG74_23665 [Kofleriaceae bacterium]|jgi:hypothetical protein